MPILFYVINAKNKPCAYKPFYSHFKTYLNNTKFLHKNNGIFIDFYTFL